MVSLRRIQKDWNEFGKTDPLWAVITADGTRGNKWDLDAFFETGRTEIAQMMQTINGLGVAVARERALDFGCGVGRLSRALSDHFENVVGVDIAPSMIELANQMSSVDGRCTYVLNDSNELRMLPSDSFDLVYSNITLQHMPPRYGRRYFEEFLRVTRSEGLIVFELLRPPKSRYRRVRAIAGRIRHQLLNRPSMRAYWMTERAVRRFFERRGATVLDEAMTYRDVHSERIRYCVAPGRGRG
jgi:ubiquinone/menaquinone biosynthesis C-methylase UbiE